MAERPVKKKQRPGLENPAGTEEPFQAALPLDVTAQLPDPSPPCVDPATSGDGRHRVGPPAQTLEAIGVAPVAGAAETAPPTAPRQGVLIVGLGDEDRGDSAVGLHLASCLAQLDWPGSVVFCQADRTVPKQAEKYAHVVLIDAIEGAELPGSLYKADPEELLANSVGGPGSGLGLLTMLSPSVRKRLSVFGIQPATMSWGSPVSMEIIASIPILVQYLRAYILGVAADSHRMN